MASKSRLIGYLKRPNSWMVFWISSRLSKYTMKEISTTLKRGLFKSSILSKLWQESVSKVPRSLSSAQVASRGLQLSPSLTCASSRRSLSGPQFPPWAIWSPGWNHSAIQMSRLFNPCWLVKELSLISKRMKIKRQHIEKKLFRISKSVIGFSWSRRSALNTWSALSERKKSAIKLKKSESSSLISKSNKLNKN